jgi:hypothetical protein
MFVNDTIKIDIGTYIRHGVSWISFRFPENSGFIWMGVARSGMSDDTGDDRTETVDVSVRFPSAFVEEELLPEYPAASKETDAIRMAVQNDIERRQQSVTPSAIRDSVVDALEEYGGTWESVQRLEIHSVENLDIGDADTVSVNGGNGDED